MDAKEDSVSAGANRGPRRAETSTSALPIEFDCWDREDFFSVSIEKGKVKVESSS